MAGIFYNFKYSEKNIVRSEDSVVRQTTCLPVHPPQVYNSQRGRAGEAIFLIVLKIRIASVKTPRNDMIADYR